MLLLTQSRYFINCKSFQDGETLCRAIECANSWIFYSKFCESSKIKPNKKILEYFYDLIPNLQTSTTLKLTYFDLFTEQYNEFCIYSILEIIKRNKLIQSIEINFNYELLEGLVVDDLISSNCLEILTSFPSYQLFEISLVR